MSAAVSPQFGCGLGGQYRVRGSGHFHCCVVVSFFLRGAGDWGSRYVLKAKRH